MNIIKISEIKINGQARRLTDDNKVRELANSIKEIGLLNPITITSDKKLVAGLHRIKAFQLLNREEIPYNIIEIQDSLRIELAEIDENLMRNELYWTESDRQILRRKKIYEELYPQVKQGGDRGNQYTGGKSQNPTSAIPSFVKDTSQKTGKSETVIKESIKRATNIIPEADQVLQQANINKTEGNLLAKKKPEEQKQIIDKIKTGEAKTINNAILAVNRDKPREVKPLPVELYDVIYSDPPWRYEHAKNSNDSIEAHYPTMDLEEIKAMKVPSADNAVLLLWVTSPKLEEGLQVLNSWGFNYRSSLIWDKSGIESGKNWIGMGYWFRGQHELLLVGVKGKFSPPKEDCRFPSIFREFKTEHSKKPEFIYGMIEKMFPGHKYLELFARNTRENWRSWGNEVK